MISLLSSDRILLPNSRSFPILFKINLHSFSLFFEFYYIFNSLLGVLFVFQNNIFALHLVFNFGSMFQLKGVCQKLVNIFSCLSCLKFPFLFVFLPLFCGIKVVFQFDYHFLWLAKLVKNVFYFIFCLV